MKSPFLFFSLLILTIHTSTASSLSPPIPSTKTTTLDPDQLEALQSFNIRTSKDPCSQPSFNNATFCDSSSPYRHLISLRLTNCSDDVDVSSSALHTLSSSLTDLQLIDCPISPLTHFPLDLAISLTSFTCIHSLQKVSGLFLSRLKNVTFLTVSNVPVVATGAYVFFGNLKKLKSVTISRASLGGSLPKHWHLDLTHVDFSGNKLNGSIPGSITLIDGLKSLDLSSNELTGVIPGTFGDLLLLENVSLASNLLSGSIPDSMKAMKSLVHIDFSSNKLNGTIPKFISELRSLRYLNLGKNEFHGVMPFNASFIKKLDVFKIGGNINLCYNHSTLPTKVKLGIAQCDKHGLPISPPPAKESPGKDDDNPSGSGDDDYSDDDSADDSSHKDGHHGPNKVVLGVAIGLSAIVFLIIFCVCISKCCH